ncbi:hypothetical protein BMS3Abin16_01258 [archaeon BMS3Abin16]|nr:hypothetical protein BMS3Abin16_01258 [archaeon BMS3Abin16]GBE56540.1 hypothetical protein BMS3Bbin16_00749 [archaeon BMS3Bbin16]
MMKKITSILILVTIFLAGCVNLNTSTTTSLMDVTRNPENYLNKTIQLEGYTVPYNIAFDEVWLEDSSNYWKIRDDQNYEFPMKLYFESGRILTPLEIYQVKGVMKYVDVCHCQIKKTFFDGSTYGWEPYRLNAVGSKVKYSTELCNNLKPKEKGPVKIEYRCEQNSNTKFYYLEVIEPMLLQ